MSQKYHHEPRRLSLGLIAAVLALFGQLLLGAVIPGQAARATLATFADDFPICHSEAPDTTGSNAPARHDQRGMDCALCRTCSTLNAVAFLPVPVPQSLVPLVAMVARLMPLPPARGPPVIVLLAATYPTGPPVRA